MKKTLTIRSRKLFAGGFTLIELTVAMAAGAILTLCVGILIADNQKNFNQIYRRVNGDATTDGFAARKAFDSICRKASLRNYFLSEDLQTLEVYYFSPASTGTFPDKYACFYPSGSDLILEHGTLKPDTWEKDDSIPSTFALARNLDRVQFQVNGTAMQMFLYFDSSANAP